jgi:hypothetical protein
MLEVEDAAYHHDSAVTLPALPSFGLSGADQSIVAKEAQPSLDIKRFQPVIYVDLWQGEFDTTPPEEELWRRSGLVYVAVTYLFSDRNPEYRMLLAGHTDTTGSDEVNFKLGELRAQNFLFLLRGERRKWVDNCLSRSKVEDFQRILKYFSTRRGWASDPGDVDNQLGDQTRQAVKGFQQNFNKDFGRSIAVDGDVGPETWGAIFDVYMDELASLLDVNVEALGGFRQKLKFVDPAHPTITCGKRVPIEAPDRDNFRSATNRRVEVLFFPASELPDLTAHLPGGAIRSGHAGREASDIYGPAADPFVFINPLWWTEPSSPQPFTPQFRILDPEDAGAGSIETSVPLVLVDPAQEQVDPWDFLSRFEEFEPGRLGPEDFDQNPDSVADSRG